MSFVISSQLSYRAEISRKLLHLSSLWMPAYVYLQGKTAILPLVAILLTLIVYEVLRRHERTKNHAYLRPFGMIVRPHEHDLTKYNLTGAFYVVLAAVLSISLFSPIVAAAALIIMLVGDTAAALIGRKWGRTKVWNKSAEGVAAFIIASIAAILIFDWIVDARRHFLPVALGGVLIGAIAEALAPKLKLDDNLAVVLAAGAFIQYFYLF